MGHQELRPGQGEALGAVLQGSDTLAVLPTGAGKSAIYQTAALMIPGPTVVVSPLIALQRDQIDGIEDNELAPAAVVNSSLSVRERNDAFERLENEDIEFILLAPEQLQNEDTFERVRAAAPSLFVVDEAHCISEWGHDFRPDYLKLGSVIEALGHPRVIALTATANPQIREEIVERLGMRNPRVIVTGFDRPNIWLGCMVCADEPSKREALLRRVVESPKPGIVYTGTRKHTEELALALGNQGLRATGYHAGMKKEERNSRQSKFMADELDVMVATNAFGMGIDKPNVRFVFHYDLSASLDAYYQEVGRAGRDGEAAQALLFYVPHDIALRRFLASTGKLKRDAMEQVFEALQAAPGATDPAELRLVLGLSRQKLTKVVTRLQDSGLVEVLENGALRLSQPPPQRQAALEAAVRSEEALRESEQRRVEKMRTYAELGSCRRAFLLTHFGEDFSPPCNACDVCERLAVAQQRVSPRGAAASATNDGPSPAGSNETPAEPFAVGARVQHRQWGIGTVLGYEGDTQEKLKVAFDNVGEKLLAVSLIAERDVLWSVS